MRTNVTLSATLYEATGQAAREDGITRSRLYSLALEKYVQQRRQDRLTEEVNLVLEDPAVQAEFAALSAHDVGLEVWRELTKNDTW
jgi:metal-responsive CopG/Arc/MetJ family transcriptional regulator